MKRFLALMSRPAAQRSDQLRRPCVQRRLRVPAAAQPGDMGGQASVTSYDSMSALWRFQGREQDTFPLSRLGIDDTALAAWLDDLQLYHFHYREYAAGFAAFLSIDPAGQDASPYMAFGDNPVNAVDPDGGWWQLALGEFVFALFWAPFWSLGASAEDNYWDGYWYAFIVGAGRICCPSGGGIRILLDVAGPLCRCREPEVCPGGEADRRTARRRDRRTGVPLPTGGHRIRVCFGAC